MHTVFLLVSVDMIGQVKGLLMQARGGIVLSLYKHANLY